MKGFGTLEYVKDKYSKTWSWKITGSKAVDVVSRLVSESWYGDNTDEAIVPDSTKNIQQIQWITERYPLQIISKTAWNKKTVKIIQSKPVKAKTEKLKRVKPGKQFKGKLLNFQKEGLDFLIKSSGNALSADEMGLGKTVQTLAYLSKEEHAFPVVVIAPLVTLSNWQYEIEKFLKKRGLRGKLVDNKTPSSMIIRKGKAEDLKPHDIYIINYELLHKRKGDLAKRNIKTIVCDEVQNLRSKSTKKYAGVKDFAALESVQHRIGLSGTPIYNRGSEIWPIVDILRPGLLGNFEEFCEYFCYVNEKGKTMVLENKRDLLRNELEKHVMLRRRKSDVLKELKEKVRYKEIVESDDDYYFTQLSKVWKKLEEEQKAAETEFDRASSYQRAMQSERLIAGMAKVPFVTNFVKNMMEIDESIVVFCHHRAIHKILHEKLAEFEPSSIIGGQTDNERNEGIKRFQEGKTRLMIAGLRAGNVGINLNNAKYVIFAELDWSPAIHLQAEDRLHRIGQKSTVFAYYLIGKDTMDDHVAKILIDKGYEIGALLDDGGFDEHKDKAKEILTEIQARLVALEKRKKE
ncbi:MAG: DEAD/DEAH box helicase [Candidatus Nitrosoabyssus spongiisocia]|nr:MAG: DEAD/DEAH box helicase [Nitrosopumilaceae archaeon AB1(1)]